MPRIFSSGTPVDTSINSNPVSPIGKEGTASASSCCIAFKCLDIASISDLTWDNISGSVERAYSISQFTDADTCVGLVNKDQLAFGYKDLDRYHPWLVQPEQLMAIATECESTGLNYSDKVVRSDGVSASTMNPLTFYSNSRDFYGHYLSSKNGCSPDSANNILFAICSS